MAGSGSDWMIDILDSVAGSGILQILQYLRRFQSDCIGLGGCAAKVDP